MWPRPYGRTPGDPDLDPDVYNAELDLQKRIVATWDAEREAPADQKKPIQEERIHLINQMRVGWPWYYTGHASHREWEAAGCPAADVYTLEDDERSRA